jgi:hypothetical protein
MWTVYDKSLLSVNTAEARLPASPLLPPAEGSEGGIFGIFKKLLFYFFSAVRLQNINEWSENALYRKDALVRYRGQVYQAVGYPQGIAAEPGFVDQQRFYQVGSRMSRCWSTVAGVMRAGSIGEHVVHDATVHRARRIHNSAHVTRMATSANPRANDVR